MNLDEIRKANELKKAKANAKKGKAESRPLLPKRPRPWLAEDDLTSEKKNPEADSENNIFNNQKDTTLEPALFEAAHKELALDELPSNELAELKPAHAKPALLEPAEEEAAFQEPASPEPAEMKPALSELAQAEPAIIEAAQVEPAALEPARDRPAIIEPLNSMSPEASASSDLPAVEAIGDGVDSNVGPADEEDSDLAVSPEQDLSRAVAPVLDGDLSNEVAADAEALVDVSTVQDVLLGKLGIRAFPVIRLYCALYDMARHSKNATVCLIRPDLMKIVGTNSNATVSRVIEKGKTFQFWKVSTIFFQKGDLKPGTYFEVNFKVVNHK